MPTDWKVPAREASEGTKLGWVSEAIQQGTNYLRAQRAYADYDIAIDLIAGMERDRLASYRSDVQLGCMKRNLREHIATLSDLRPFWGYKTENRDLYNQAGVLNKLLMGWFFETMADRGIRRGVQWAKAMGTGWISPVYRPDDWTVGKGDIYLQDYGPKDVLIIQPTKDNNHQRAYAVGIRNEVPISVAHSMWPDYAHKIKPDREAPSMLQRGVEKVQRFLSPVLNVVGMGGNSGKDNMPAVFPMVDIWHWYVQDDTLNIGLNDVWMGEPNTSWHYKVPFYNSDIPDGYNKDGTQLYRKARREDCRMYPFRRLMIATASCLPYDNTSHYWHGKVPLVRITNDDWPWEPYGFSAVRQAATVDRSINKNTRSIDDTLQVRPSPPMAYDQSAVPTSTMERLDTRKPNVKIGLNMQMGEAAKPFLSAEYYTVDAAQFTHIQNLREALDHMMGVSDIKSLAKGRTSANPDSLERLMEMAGPIVKDDSRNMESGLRDLGSMMKCNFFQFYTTKRKVQILGASSITDEDYDYDPGNMIPSHMPWEKELQKENRASQHSQIERAKYWHEQFSFKIVPNSMHQITQMTRKLLYLQLEKGGMPLDPWTKAEVFDIPNFGPAPEGATTIIERWMAWEDMKVERQLEIAQKLQAAGIGGPGGGGGGGHQPGRKPSGQQSPRMVSKDGGTRQTIAESR